MPTFYGPPSDGTVIPQSLETALAADVRAPESPIGAAVGDAAAGVSTAELYADFRAKADGAVPAEFDTGQALQHAATVPVIEAGALVTPAVDGSRTATYVETALAGKLTRVGAEFVIRRATVDQADGALAMGAWSDPGVIATYPGTFPIAGAHFVITRTSWYYNFYGDADSSNVAGATFATPLAEGVPLKVELVFDGPRVVINLPDGTTVTFSDPRAEQYVNSRPFWEPFMETGNLRTSAAITQTWADSAADETTETKFATRRELSLRTRPQVAARSVAWRPSTDQYINLPDSTAPAPINAGLYVDIVLPESRQFVVTASAALEKPGASVPYWLFTGDTSLTLGVARLSPNIGTETITAQVLVDLSANGSYKAGNVVRVGWSHYKGGVDRITLQTGNGRYPTLTVTPVVARVVTAV